MRRTVSKSPYTSQVIHTLESLQKRFVQNLEKMARAQNELTPFTEVAWLRGGGKHGGGSRFEAPKGSIFNAGSVNVSHVHYDDDAHRPLQSATALSAIIHPRNPFAPSIHVHLSWTELKSGHGYWRVMADLNPSIGGEEFKKIFDGIITHFGEPHVAEAMREGDKYFFIPALGRHRGISHFYLEDYRGDSFHAALAYCELLIGGIIDAFPLFVSEATIAHPSPSAHDQSKQLEYHTLYFLQVLTLDRGTTAGLMVHDQNDLGIMASLPAEVDRATLESWIPLHEHPKVELLRGLIDTLPKDAPVATIGPAQKLKLAACIRDFYTRHPQALSLQASGSKVPRTVDQHG